MEIKRGDVFWVENGKVTGCEVAGTRPAVIVSNDKANCFSSLVTIVWLCSNESKPLPTHCKVKGYKLSTAMCESVTTVSKERVGDYIRSATEEEMEAVDKCLKIHMDLMDRRTKEEILERRNPENLDEMIAILGVAPVIGYLRCKVYEHKNDPSKSRWYMDKLMELKRNEGGRP